MNEAIWSPSPERVGAANLTSYMHWLRERRLWSGNDFADLYRWSIDCPVDFWPSVWDFAKLTWRRRPDAVVENLERMPGARWFPGGQLNFSEALLRFTADNASTAIGEAVVFANELGQRRALTWGQLAAATTRVAAALAADGVQAGDRVVGYLPNLPEAIVAMLATTRLGAIWSSCSPDFGIQGVLDRFGQIGPKVLFTADGYSYGGKQFDSLEKARSIVQRLDNLARVVVVPYIAERPQTAGLGNAALFDDYGANMDAPAALHRDFDWPTYILYTSGTTGVPKCIIHGAGGTLLQHIKELVLHTDLKPGDRLFYFTTCGWMMWNWLVSGLAVGATVVLYDGSPFHPAPDALFDLAERERITAFGASAKFFAAAEKAGVSPATQRDLGSLRTILSTGSPLAPASFDYVYQKVKADVCLSSISGGTDIVSCFVLGNPIGPVYRGEIQTRGLGMRVDVFDDDGRSSRGRPGELVCTQSFPSMPVGFWNDPDGSRFHAAYFERFPYVWHHGDWAEITERGGVVIYGRSDATLNPGGVRIGTAEIYRQVELLPEIVDSLVVGQEWDNDVRVILFVKLRAGTAWSTELAERIRTHIRANTTPRHVPAKIIPIPDIPRTISGKITELAVRNIIHGRPVKNADALANPEALEHFRNLEELRAPVIEK